MYKDSKIRNYQIFFNAIIDNNLLDDDEIIVWLTLNSIAKGRDMIDDLSKRELYSKIRKRKENVDKCLKSLHDKGYILVVNRRVETKKNDTNVYYLAKLDNNGVPLEESLRLPKERYKYNLILANKKNK